MAFSRFLFRNFYLDFVFRDKRFFFIQRHLIKKFLVKRKHYFQSEFLGRYVIIISLIYMSSPLLLLSLHFECVCLLDIIRFLPMPVTFTYIYAWWKCSLKSNTSDLMTVAATCHAWLHWQWLFLCSCCGRIGIVVTSLSLLTVPISYLFLLGILKRPSHLRIWVDSFQPRTYHYYSMSNTLFRHSIYVDDYSFPPYLICYI